MVDTGVDVTIIRKDDWPDTWPLIHLKGIGQNQYLHKSSKTLKWRDHKSNQGTIQPYVIAELPINLWGHDLLSQLEIIMCSPNEVVTMQCLKMDIFQARDLEKMFLKCCNLWRPFPELPE